MAEVDGAPIHAEDLIAAELLGNGRELPADRYWQLLDDAIDRLLARQEAARRGIALPARERARLEQLEARMHRSLDGVAEEDIVFGPSTIARTIRKREARAYEAALLRDAGIRANDDGSAHGADAAARRAQAGAERQRYLGQLRAAATIRLRHP